MESELRDNAGSATGSWPAGNSYTQSAMEHKAIVNLKNLGNDRQGYIQWHDKLVNPMAQVHGEYRVVLQLIVRAVEREEKLPTKGNDEWADRINEKEVILS